MADKKPLSAMDLANLMATDYPLLPGEEVERFVERYFQRRETYLETAGRCGAPLYLLEAGTLREKAARFRAAFGQVLPDTAFYYAVKSNNHPDVSRILTEAGFGLDVSSGPELQMALALACDAIVFSGPGKTPAELRLAVDNAARVVVLVDSFGELERLAEIAAAAGRVMRIGVRLTTNPDGLWRKFGIPLEQLGAFIRQAGRFSGIDFRGLQFHTSWNLSPANQAEFIAKLGMALRELPGADLARISFIDIGGGYWPPQGEWLLPEGTIQGKVRGELGAAGPARGVRYRMAATPIEVFAAGLGQVIREHILALADCRICFEPGRWLCNDAMHLLLTVVDRKAEDLVITDAGTNAVGWERFETDYFPVLNLSQPAMTERACHVLGSLCTPHDVWGYAYWGRDIAPGDILMIPTQGAYTYSLRQNFIKELPRVVTI